MSVIYFHACGEKAGVCGAERAHFAVFFGKLVWAILGDFAEERCGEKSILRHLFPPGHYTHSGDFARNVKIALNSYQGTLSLGERKIGMFALHLNTATSMGSDFVRLAARLHGQCELHAYVEGHNRKWLAGIIKKGRESRFYRDDMGWESVIKLLEKDNASPIVTSYSVCDSFPNSCIADFKDDDGDAWDALPREQQWELGITGLRQLHSLELRPENLGGSFCFGTTIDANKLIDILKTIKT